MLKAASFCVNKDVIELPVFAAFLEFSPLKYKAIWISL